MTRIAAGEVTLDYRIDGAEGDWLLMIHGLGYAKWGWEWQLPALSKHFRVITFDNRGIGDSDAPPGPYTVAEMAGDAANLLEALGIEKAHVLGTSLGGFIAQELAITYPERVDRLILACTGFGGPRFIPMPEVTVKLLAAFPTLTQDQRYRLSTENGFTEAFVQARPDVMDRVIEHRLRVNQGFEPWSWQSNAGATFDASDRVGQIKHETLVITGESDNVVDFRNSELLASEFPNATLRIVPGGHLFFIEEADLVNSIVVSFLTVGGAG